MAEENTTIARPYARAAFEYAVAGDSLAQWSTFLAVGSMTCLDSTVADLLIDPRVSEAQQFELFAGVCQRWMDEKKQNFLRLLVKNNRLAVLPEIAVLYESYRAEHEKTVDVDVVSFMPLSAEQQQRMSASLKLRLKREVSLHCRVDEKILGGVIVRAGDLVIDGSVLSQLQKMQYEVTA